MVVRVYCLVIERQLWIPFSTFCVAALAGKNRVPYRMSTDLCFTPLTSTLFPSQDGHPEVESECRALVKYIEGVLGESIESYLV